MNYTQDEVNEIYGCDMTLFNTPVEYVAILLEGETMPEQDTGEITPDIIEEAVEIFGNGEDTPDLIEEIKNHTCDFCGKKISAYETELTPHNELVCLDCFNNWNLENQYK